LVNVRSHLLHSNGPINMEIEANFIVFIFNSYLVKPIKLPFGMENYGIIIFFEKSPIKSIRIPCMIIVLSSILPSLAQTHRKMAIWMSKNWQKLEKNPKNCLFFGAIFWHSNGNFPVGHVGLASFWINKALNTGACLITVRVCFFY